MKYAIFKQRLSRGVTPSTIQYMQPYLKYCKENDISLNSTTFKGTLYELAAKTFLENSLHCKNLLKVGGSYDSGIDILGKWNLAYFWQNALHNHEITKTGKAKKKTLLRDSMEYQHHIGIESNNELISLSRDVNILVQCKNYDKKIKASTIRELTGVYHYHVKKKRDFIRNYIFLISSQYLTKQARMEMDTTKIPIIHCKLKPIKYRDGDIFDVSNWDKEVLDSVYLNPVTRQYLDGLNMELQLKAITMMSSLGSGSIIERPV